MSLCLTDDELVELTKKRRCSAQVKALRQMGIQHWIRGDGTPAVLRANLDGSSTGAKVKEYPFGRIKRATSAET